MSLITGHLMGIGVVRLGGLLILGRGVTWGLGILLGKMVSRSILGGSLLLSRILLLGISSWVWLRGWRRNRARCRRRCRRWVILLLNRLLHGDGLRLVCLLIGVLRV